MGQVASGRYVAWIWLLVSALALSACGGGSGSSQDTLTVSGRVINGPLDDARVLLSNQAGVPLAETRSDSSGAFTLQLAQRVEQIQLRSEGGMLAGQPYLGSLSAICAIPAGATTVSCNVTPFSSIVVDLVENRGRSLSEAQTLLASLLPIGGDPFVLEQDAGSLPAYRFDLAAARSAINGGAGLSAWVAALGDWALNPDALAPPPGSPVFNVIANRRAGQGSISPPSRLLAWGEQASFTLTPAANHVIRSVTGCGGSLDPVSGIYTTAAVTGAGSVTGVCQVDVFFAIEEFSVTYQAGPGGTIDGDAEQSVPFQGNSRAVTAVPEEGFEFVDWSDGNSNPVRSDSGIISDLAVTANFVRQQFTVRYQAAANGSLLVDGMPQSDIELTVEFGQDGPQVEALPDQNFIFSGWSLAPATTNPRQDTNIRSDLVATAFFEPAPNLLPWLSAPHRGDLQVIVRGPSAAEVSWPQQPGVSYELFVGPTADMNLNQVAMFGGQQLLDVTPPVLLAGLPAEQPVYVALRAAGADEVLAHSSFVPRPWGLDGTLRDEVTDLAGRRYLGGDFTRVLQAAAAGAVPIAPPLGAAQATPLVMPEIDGVVYAAAPDGLGGWYIGGRFSAVDGQPRQNLAHLDRSGRLTESTLSVSGVDAEVRALQVVSTALLVGGRFDQAADGTQSLSRTNLALFVDDQLVAEFAPDITGLVRTLAIDNANAALFVGGDITAAAGLPRNGIVQIDLQTNTVTDWQQGVNGPVHKLLLALGGLFVGGEFTESRAPGGAAATVQSGLLVLNASSGSVLSGLQATLSGAAPVRVNDIFVDDSQLLVVGRFDTAQGESRQNIAAFLLGGELTLAPMPVATDAEIRSLTTDGSIFYIGGAFSAVIVDGVNAPRAGVAAFSAADGSLLAWQPQLIGTVEQVVALPVFVDGATLPAVPLVLGQFSAVDARPRAALARLDDNGNLDDWTAAVNGSVHALALTGETLYVGGNFTAAGSGSEPRQNLAAFERTSGALLPWSASVAGTVNSVLVESGEIFVGGDFLATGSSSGDLPRAYLAAFDSVGIPLAWQPAANAPVNRLLSIGGLIYVAGAFTEIDTGSGAQPRLRLAALDSNSGLLQSWNPGANDEVRALTSDNGNIYFGGDFTQAGNGVADIARLRLAAADSAGQLLAWDPGANASVRDLSASNGVVYAAGDFTAVGAGSADTERLGVAAVAAASGSVDSWYPAELSGALMVLAENGLIAVGGNFVEAPATDGSAARRLRLRRVISDAAGNLLAAP